MLENKQCVLYFHGNGGYANVPLCYVISTLPVLFRYSCDILSYAQGEEYVDLSFVRLIIKSREYFETKHY